MHLRKEKKRDFYVRTCTFKSVTRENFQFTLFITLLFKRTETARKRGNFLSYFSLILRFAKCSEPSKTRTHKIICDGWH
jgi:hypothetical protein